MTSQRSKKFKKQLYRSADKDEYGFAQIDNRTLRDADLSFAATGLLAYALSHSDSFDIAAELLNMAKTDGKTKVKTIIKELERKGYLRIEGEGRAKNGRFQEVIYIFFERPQSVLNQYIEKEKINPSNLLDYEHGSTKEKPERKSRIGKSATGNQPIKNTKEENQEKTSSTNLLVWPTPIPTSERKVMESFLKAIELGQAQMLVDDLWARIQNKSSPVKNRVAYFRSMVTDYEAKPDAYHSASRSLVTDKSESKERDQAHLKQLREASELARDKLFAEHQNEIMASKLVIKPPLGLAKH